LAGSQDVALPAASRATCPVAEILGKDCVIPLHAGCGRGVTATHGAVDHVKASLPLVQPQLEVGTAGPREVLCSPLNVEDTVGCSPRYRGKDAKPGVYQIQVIPVREDGVVVGEPRQTLVGEGGIRGGELRIAVGRQIQHGKRLIVQCVREWQRNGGYLIIPVIADVRRARHNAAAYLSYHVLRGAGRRWCRRGAGRCRGGWCRRSGWGWTC